MPVMHFLTHAARVARSRSSGARVENGSVADLFLTHATALAHCRSPAPHATRRGGTRTGPLLPLDAPNAARPERPRRATYAASRSGSAGSARAAKYAPAPI